MFSWRNRRHFLDCTHTRTTHTNTSGVTGQKLVAADGNRIAITFALTPGTLSALGDGVALGEFSNGVVTPICTLSVTEMSKTVYLSDVGDRLFSAIYIDAGGLNPTITITELLLRKEEN